MTAKIYLPVVTDADADDTVIEMKVLPAFKGGDVDENLACGSCKAVIAKGVSTGDFYGRFVVGKRLLALCPCGAHNVIPTKTDPEVDRGRNQPSP